MSHAKVEPDQPRRNFGRPRKNADQPIENVGRGAAFALLSIPAAMVILGVIGSAVGVITGFITLVVPYIAAWLYRKGAKAPLGKRGRPAFVIISAAAIVIGTAVAVISGLYNAFSSVGGDGGPLGSAFLTTVRIQLTTNLEQNAIAILIGLGLGAAGIVGVLRAGRTEGAGSPANSDSASSDSVKRGPVTPEPAAAPGEFRSNQPSPGIMLNGKPLDPDKK